jgi:alkanesulfonate monooxygenase SsuD/methylene tetrahydromethanopterin reductase-like flavin-dependent oxidoreductase (luciferase family)
VTSTLLLGTGVVPITARRAQTTAMAAATVHDISGGRFVLGLGAGFERSIEAVRAYVGEVRATRPAFDAATPPVWLAALGDRMVRLAGEIADGVLLNWCTPERVARARTIVAEEAQRAGRDPATVGVYVRACMEPDEAVALAALKPQVVQYASIPHYRRQLEAMGFVAESEAAAHGDPPDSLVRALCVLGDPSAARGRLDEYREAGADLPFVYPVPALEPVSSLMGTILALAPA